jgi:hypothetical protein
MSVRYGGKKVVINSDPWADEDVAVEEEDDDAICVQYWIGHSDDEDYIGIENGFNVDADQMPVSVALQVADAIRDLAKWPTTKAGKKEIDRLREKLFEGDAAQRRSSPSESTGDE